MSLFGDGDENGGLPAPRGSRKGGGSTGGGGLFGEESDPWLPSPKKRNTPIASLLDNADIPDIYIDLYDALCAASPAGRPTAASFAAFLRRGADGVDDGTVDRVMAVLGVVDGGGVVSQGLANAGFVLVALAQAGEEVSVDGVDDVKDRGLPVPKFTIEKAPVSAEEASPSMQIVPQVETPDTDPFVNGHTPTRPQPHDTPAPTSSQQQQRHTHHDDDPWGTAPRQHTAPATPASAQARRSSPTPQYDSRLHASQADAGFGVGESAGYRMGSTEDTVTIAALPDRQGLPLWKHVNYTVRCVSRGSEVVRRYSDFAWLFECLVKKYPFRAVPLLPPKRLLGSPGGGAGSSADSSFMERRRRGLVRFANALDAHPVLRDDTLVTTFLTVQTELALWRKSAAIDLAEEFESKYLSADLEPSLPGGIDAWADRTRSALKPALESFTALVSTQERLMKRRDSLAGELGRFAELLEGFVAGERGSAGGEALFPTIGREGGPSISRGLSHVAGHAAKEVALRNLERTSEQDGVLELLKRHRDCLLAMQELFARHHKLAGDNVPQLERRIAHAKSRVSTLEGKIAAGSATEPSVPTTKEQAEVEKLTTQVSTDEVRVKKLLDRRVLIRECVWRELQAFDARQVGLPALVGAQATHLAHFAGVRARLAEALAGDVEGL